MSILVIHLFDFYEKGQSYSEVYIYSVLYLFMVNFVSCAYCICIVSSMKFTAGKKEI